MNAILRDLAHQYAAVPNSVIRTCAESLLAELRQVVCNNVNCLAYQVEVRLFGSIANNTHGPGSDADIAVIPVGCHGGSEQPDSHVICDVLKFRNVLFGHLQKQFGSRFVCRQRKAILLCGTTQRMQADVVALLPKVWCNFCPGCKRSHCDHGYEIRSYCEPERAISTWPEQHQANASAFDIWTERRFSQSMRVLKGLLKSGLPGFSDVADCMPPVLFESLLSHVPVRCFHHVSACPLRILQHVTEKIQEGLRDGSFRDRCELSGMRRLFDDSQTWNFHQVRRDIDRLRRLLG